MILVIGATGNIGKELVPQLLEAGAAVRVFSRSASKVAQWGSRVEVAIGDLEQPQTLDTAMRGVQSLFLVTGGSAQQDINAVEAAKRAGVERIVKLSTMEASDAVIQVGKWHREREQIIEASGLAWTFLRPSMFMSNSIEWWAEGIKNMGAVFFPGGKGKVAPIDPRDIATVATLALTQPGHAGKAYTLTGAELLSVGDMVQIISQVIDRPLGYTSIPPLGAKMWMLKSGMDATLVNALMEMLNILRKGKGAVVTDTLTQLTGRAPRTFEAWCREHAHAFLAEPKTERG